jgi:hypothetical protein
MQMDTQPDKHTMRTDRQAKSPAAMVWDLVFAALINPKYRQTGSDYLGTSLVLGIWLLVLEMWEQPYSVYYIVGLYVCTHVCILSCVPTAAVSPIHLVEAWKPKENCSPDFLGQVIRNDGRPYGYGRVWEGWRGSHHVAEPTCECTASQR